LDVAFNVQLLDVLERALRESLLSLREAEPGEVVRAHLEGVRDGQAVVDRDQPGGLPG